MPLSKETKDRIAKDGAAYASKHGRKEIGYYSLNYIAGAETEAERAADLIETLTKIRRYTTDNDIQRMAENALTKYNSK